MAQLELTEEASKQLAKHIVTELIVQLSNDETVRAVSSVWGKYLDQWIGRGFRRFAFYVFAAALVAGAIKFQAWNFMSK